MIADDLLYCFMTALQYSTREKNTTFLSWQESSVSRLLHKHLQQPWNIIILRALVWMSKCRKPTPVNLLWNRNTHITITLAFPDNTYLHKDPYLRKYPVWLLQICSPNNKGCMSIWAATLRGSVTSRGLKIELSSDSRYFTWDPRPSHTCTCYMLSTVHVCIRGIVLLWIKGYATRSSKSHIGNRSC